MEVKKQTRTVQGKRMTKSSLREKSKKKFLKKKGMNLHDTKNPSLFRGSLRSHNGRYKSAEKAGPLGGTGLRGKEPPTLL